MIDGKTFVLHVYHGTPADRAGIKPGDEIISVDGKPYEPIGSFRAGGKASVQVRRSANGEPITIEVPINSIRPGEMFRDAIRSSARVIEQDGRRIGYVRVWTYATRGVHSLLTELLSSEPLKSTDALVLDLRSRWGGAPPEASELILGRSPDMILIDPRGNRVVASTRWRKPVVALIDEGTRSGMEIFAHALKNAGIKLIGTRSAGAVLAGRGFLLEDNSLLVLAIRDVLVDGQRLEGPGVTPDIEVARDIRYSGGADPVLERGLKEIAGILTKRS
jgi:carboxyl-terminal processing protease